VKVEDWKVLLCALGIIGVEIMTAVVLDFMGVG
jgi:hypothetical protein